MVLDPSKFNPINVADTCAVWNLLSSQLLHAAALRAGCSFSCTRYVKYECLDKPRRTPSDRDVALMQRLGIELQKGSVGVYPLSIEDLQEVAVLEMRMQLSKGELSSIAFAMKIGQAFMTDDQGARRLAEQVMDRDSVQTTPHLLGWLYFIDQLGDSDKERIVEEHKSFNRPLASYFDVMYHEGLRCRLMANGTERSVDMKPDSIAL